MCIGRSVRQISEGVPPAAPAHPAGWKSNTTCSCDTSRSSESDRDAVHTESARRYGAVLYSTLDGTVGSNFLGWQAGLFGELARSLLTHRTAELVCMSHQGTAGRTRTVGDVLASLLFGWELDPLWKWKWKWKWRRQRNRPDRPYGAIPYRRDCTVDTCSLCHQTHPHRTVSCIVSLSRFPTLSE